MSPRNVLSDWQQVAAIVLTLIPVVLAGIAAATNAAGALGLDGRALAVLAIVTAVLITLANQLRSVGSEPPPPVLPPKG